MGIFEVKEFLCEKKILGIPNFVDKTWFCVLLTEIKV